MHRVEQPVGVGFSTGEVRATSEDDVAKDFVDFFLNFQNLFGISKFKIFVTGESYAGIYVPYISAEMLDRKDPDHLDVQGEPDSLFCAPRVDAEQVTSYMIPALAPGSGRSNRQLQCHGSSRTTTSWGSTARFWST